MKIALLPHPYQLNKFTISDLGFPIFQERFVFILRRQILHHLANILQVGKYVKVIP